MRLISFALTFFVLLATLVLVAPLLAEDVAEDVAGDLDNYKVIWGQDYDTLTIHYPGGTYEYPKDMLKEKFPPPGKKPDYEIEKHWPVVFIRARWSESLKEWPAKYRPDALDLVLMFACDAQLYQYVYPKIIKSSSFTFPPEYLKEAEDLSRNLAEEMRGKEVGYEVTAIAGFGASDYKIKTMIRIGLSKDNMTFFYRDSPEYISDYLDAREFFFAAHDAGDRMEYEALTASLCKPRKMFKDTALNRIESSGKYFIDKLYESLHGTPTEEEIDNYLELVKESRHENINTVIKRYEKRSKEAK